MSPFVQISMQPDGTRQQIWGCTVWLSLDIYLCFISTHFRFLPSLATIFTFTLVLPTPCHVLGDSGTISLLPDPSQRSQENAYWKLKLGSCKGSPILHCNTSLFYLICPRVVEKILLKTEKLDSCNCSLQYRVVFWMKCRTCRTSFTLRSQVIFKRYTLDCYWFLVQSLAAHTLPWKDAHLGHNSSAHLKQEVPRCGQSHRLILLQHHILLWQHTAENLPDAVSHPLLECKDSCVRCMSPCTVSYGRIWMRFVGAEFVECHAMHLSPLGDHFHHGTSLWFP